MENMALTTERGQIGGLELRFSWFIVLATIAGLNLDKTQVCGRAAQGTSLARPSFFNFETGGERQDKNIARTDGDSDGGGSRLGILLSSEETRQQTHSASKTNFRNRSAKTKQNCRRIEIKTK